VRKVFAAGDITASVVSYWELVLKKGGGTAPVAQPAVWWDRYITRPAVEVLPVRIVHIDQLDALPEWHRDPFDRMLLAQALAENYTLVSRDSLLARCGTPVVWQ
jgi:PIN domain nuclease of toxin-antitoxin system